MDFEKIDVKDLRVVRDRNGRRYVKISYTEKGPPEKPEENDPPARRQDLERETVPARKPKPEAENAPARSQKPKPEAENAPARSQKPKAETAPARRQNPEREAVLARRQALKAETAPVRSQDPEREAVPARTRVSKPANSSGGRVRKIWNNPYGRIAIIAVILNVIYLLAARVLT